MTERPSISLPDPIAAYFAADRLDADAVAQCFTNDAVVKDEGETHAGLAAIRQWKAKAAAKYTYTCAPLRLEREPGLTVVHSHLEGDFPGGQVDLRFIFRLERGMIASLEIKP